MSIPTAPARDAAQVASARDACHASLPFRTADALRELPTRRPADPPARTSSIQWTRVAPDRYEVRLRDRVIGFVDVVGAVFVTLIGSRYDRAEEVVQTLVWTEALNALAPPARRTEGASRKSRDPQSTS